MLYLTHTADTYTQLWMLEGIVPRKENQVPKGETEGVACFKEL